MEILYEDNHLLIVNKAANWIVQGATPDQWSLLEWARGYIKEKYNKPGNVFIGVVSRLDGPVTGAVPFARTSKAASRLSEQLRTNSTIKRYWAIVDRGLREKSGRLEHWLVRNDAHAITIASNQESRSAQRGVLEYKHLGSTELGELVEIQLITGRKHQIRAQFQAIGASVVGDFKYGSHTHFETGIALHCRQVAFDHPTREERIDVLASPPKYWPQLPDAT